MARAQTLTSNSKVKNDAIKNVPVRTMGSYSFSSPLPQKAMPITIMRAPSTARSKEQSDGSINEQLWIKCRSIGIQMYATKDLIEATTWKRTSKLISTTPYGSDIWQLPHNGYRRVAFKKFWGISRGHRPADKVINATKEYLTDIDGVAKLNCTWSNDLLAAVNLPTEKEFGCWFISVSSIPRRKKGYYPGGAIQLLKEPYPADIQKAMEINMVGIPGWNLAERMTNNYESSQHTESFKRNALNQDQKITIHFTGNKSKISSTMGPSTWTITTRCSKT